MFREPVHGALDDLPFPGDGGERVVGARDDYLLLASGPGGLEIVLGVGNGKVFILLRMDDQRRPFEMADSLQRLDLLDILEELRRDKMAAVLASAVAVGDRGRRGPAGRP